MKNLSQYTDEELIVAMRDGDSSALDYLIHKYKNLVKIKARAYFIAGADNEDVIQEGMIGLFKAVRDYDAGKNVVFGAFAQLCISRQMITAIRSATRRKHMPLNNSISLSTPDYIDGSGHSYLSDPEALFIGSENKKVIEEFITTSLSKMENRVLSLYMEGNSYAQIAVALNKDEKAIENALRRVRKKLEKI